MPMRRVDKYDTKKLVGDLFDRHGIVQLDMAKELSLTKGYLSQILSENSELDGFVFGYLKYMGYLVDEHPVVFNEIDTHVQTIFDGWRKPLHKLSGVRDSHLFMFDKNALDAELFRAVYGNKPESEIRVALAKLIGHLTEFQRSLGLKEIELVS